MQNRNGFGGKKETLNVLKQVYFCQTNSFCASNKMKCRNHWKGKQADTLAKRLLKINTGYKFNSITLNLEFQTLSDVSIWFLIIFIICNFKKCKCRFFSFIEHIKFFNLKIFDVRTKVDLIVTSSQSNILILTIF